MPLRLIENDEKHSQLRTLYCGLLSSVSAKYVSHPLDVIKVRFQVQTKNSCRDIQKYTNLFQAIRVIYKEETIFGFYKGLRAAVNNAALRGVTQFWVYDNTVHILKETSIVENEMMASLISGINSGFISVLLYNPFDLIQTHLMASRKRDIDSHIVRRMHSVYKQNGIKGLYNGAICSLVQVPPLYGSKFMLYYYFSKVLSDYVNGQKTSKSTLPMWAMVLAGALSGSLSNCLTHPLDVIKKQMQTSQQSPDKDVQSGCKRLGKCFRHIFTTQGVPGFYRGLQTCVLKSAISSAVSLSTFDLLKSIL